MLNRIRITKAYDNDSIRWRAMCTVVNKYFFQERSLTFKAIYSNSNKLKGFEICRPGSSSVIGYVDVRDYLLYFIYRKKVDSQAVNLRSDRFDTQETAAVRYVGHGMFEYRGVIR